MRKLYCDCCNSEVDAVTEYILPMRKSIECKDKSGATILCTAMRNPQKIELCQQCIATLGSMIDSGIALVRSGRKLVGFKIDGQSASDNSTEDITSVWVQLNE